jgi:hypothetical protein
MLTRVVGVLVMLLAFSGCAYLGVQEMVTEQRVGGWPAMALILLAGPLLAVGWVTVRIGGLFIHSWRHDYLNETRRERRFAGLAVATLVGGLLYGGVVMAVPSQHPGHALTAALKAACTDGAIDGAGGSHISGAATAHLVVLDPEGNEQRWTGRAPIEWKPASLADTELVSCVSDEDVMALIETCQYINGPSIKRYAATRHVKVVEAATARVVAEFNVGDSPRQCRQTEQRDLTELKGKVEWEMVQSRLASLAGCCAPSSTTSSGRPGVQPQVTPGMSAPPVPSPAVPAEPTAPPPPVETAVPVQPETPVP